MILPHYGAFGKSNIDQSLWRHLLPGKTALVRESIIEPASSCSVAHVKLLPEPKDHTNIPCFSQGAYHAMPGSSFSKSRSPIHLIHDGPQTNSRNLQSSPNACWVHQRLIECFDQVSKTISAAEPSACWSLILSGKQ